MVRRRGRPFLLKLPQLNIGEPERLL